MTLTTRRVLIVCSSVAAAMAVSYLLFFKVMLFGTMSNDSYWEVVEGGPLQVSSPQEFIDLRDHISRTFVLRAGQPNEFADPTKLEFTLHWDKEKNLLERTLGMKTVRFEIHLRYNLVSPKYEFRHGWFKVRDGTEYQSMSRRSEKDPDAIRDAILLWHK